MQAMKIYRNVKKQGSRRGVSQVGMNVSLTQVYEIYWFQSFLCILSLLRCVIYIARPFAVMAKICGVPYNQASSIAFDETSSS